MKNPLLKSLPEISCVLKDCKLQYPLCSCSHSIVKQELILTGKMIKACVTRHFNKVSNTEFKQTSKIS